MESPEFSNDVNKHLKEDFINDFSSAIETAETKLVGNICELKYDIAELKQTTWNGWWNWISNGGVDSKK